MAEKAADMTKEDYQVCEIRIQRESHGLHDESRLDSKKSECITTKMD